MDTERDATSLVGRHWSGIFKAFELLVVLCLMVLLMIVIAISALELGWLLLRDLSSIRALLLDVEEMFDLFSFFLLVLIGLGLFTSLACRGRVVQVEVVFEVALIEIAQKIIILDTSRIAGFALLGQAGLVLAAAFWLVRIARTARAPGPPAPKAKTVER